MQVWPDCRRKSESTAIYSVAVLRLAETHAEVRDLLRAEGLGTKVGTIDRFTSVADAVESFESEKP